MDAAISAWSAAEFTRVLGQELPGRKLHWGLASAATERGPDDWKQFQVSQPLKSSSPSKSIVGTCWVLTWKMIDGKEDVKARLVAKGYQDPDLSRP